MAEGYEHPQVNSVSRHDVYVRLGKIEDLVNKVAREVTAIKSQMEGPPTLRQRVERLELWRSKILGAGAILTLALSSGILLAVLR